MERNDFLDRAVSAAEKIVAQTVFGLDQRQKNQILSALLIYTVQEMMNERGCANTITTLIDASEMVKTLMESKTRDADEKK